MAFPRTSGSVVLEQPAARRSRSACTTTLLGLAFALLHKRTGFRAKGLLRLLAILPIITPPFVIGLGIILLFGRNGVATWLLSELFGIPPSRWIYGFFGLLLVQTLAFTPIAYLVLIGVVEGISPSMEEAAQTLRADRWRTFRTVTWPLMRPGPRQRLPDRLRRKPRRFRQSAGARRQFRRAFDRHLLRHRRLAERSRPRRGALDRAAVADALGLRPAAALARPPLLHDDVRQGRFRPSGASCPTACAGSSTATTMPWLALHVPALRHHPGRRLRRSRSASTTRRRSQHYVTAFGIEWTDQRAAVDRPRLAVLLHDHRARGDRRAAHRRDRAAHRLSAQPAALLRANRPSSS